jgi:hypothetical protein
MACLIIIDALWSHTIHRVCGEARWKIMRLEEWWIQDNKYIYMRRVFKHPTSLSILRIGNDVSERTRECEGEALVGGVAEQTRSKGQLYEGKGQALRWRWGRWSTYATMLGKLYKSGNYEWRCSLMGISSVDIMPRLSTSAQYDSTEYVLYDKLQICRRLKICK